LLSVYKSHLATWRGAVVNQYAAAWKKLVPHLVILASVVALLAGFAEAVRRFTVRYVHDANRRRMILIVQRILLWLGIILVTAFAFASDLSSLATVLGLLTAGVAGAFQNVILAVLGYFVLVGSRRFQILSFSSRPPQACSELVRPPHGLTNKSGVTFCGAKITVFVFQ